MPILGSSSGLAYIAFAPKEEQDALLALLARSSDSHDALARDPGKLGGQWSVKGTRIPV
jgi:DNA-binding IclR family transcriptional regulator